jgi:lambda family phage portal protein
MSQLWFDTPLGQALMQKLDVKPAQHRQVSRVQTRMYASARGSRFFGTPAQTSSADAELATSLVATRNRSRMLVRDASYAKRARTVVVNNVIGSGIGMQGQIRTTRNTLNTSANQALEEAWDRWCEGLNCHTGGRLHFADMERLLLGEVFEAGDVGIRIHYSKFGDSEVPLSLEVVESERLLDDFHTPYVNVTPGNQLRMGIEVDAFGRPQFYWLRKRHPSDLRFTDLGPDTIERVPADQFIHLAVIDRWPQTRGAPWMHTAIRRLNDMDGYSEAEIIRARAQAVRMGFIETPEEAADFSEETDDGSFEIEMEPGLITRLNPGEKWQESQVTAPNPQLDPFMRYMLREMAAGTGVSYESLSRDYSQSNYSSSRLALLDDRDLWKTLQLWFIRNFRTRVHRLFVRQAVLAVAVPGISVEQYALDSRKFEAVRFKPRGWTWIDPTKEVEAATQAVKSGFTTVSEVIAQNGNGRDIEDVIEERRQELDMMDEADLVFETSPDFYIEEQHPDPAPSPPPNPDESNADESTNPAKSRVFAIGSNKR